MTVKILSKSGKLYIFNSSAVLAIKPDPSFGGVEHSQIVLSDGKIREVLDILLTVEDIYKQISQQTSGRTGEVEDGSITKGSKEDASASGSNVTNGEEQAGR